MGAELFEMSWVQGIVQFFNYLAWTLYVIGLIVACFECGINYAGGKGDIRAVALNAIKGFMAASLFSVVPVRLYQLAISLQAEFTSGMTGYGTSIGEVAANIIQEYEEIETVADLIVKPISGFEAVTSPIMVIVCIIMMAYAVIKVFFANLKRGGILLIQIAVGSLYLFSVPRGDYAELLLPAADYELKDARCAGAADARPERSLLGLCCKNQGKSHFSLVFFGKIWHNTREAINPQILNGWSAICTWTVR